MFAREQLNIIAAPCRIERGFVNKACFTILFFLFIFLNSGPVAAQGYGNWWYFGDLAGIDFNQSPPISVTGTLVTQEGCSSISDAAGNLEFYTDGSTVYAKTHTVMANGTGLLGHNSTAQSAVIVKQPGNANIYYIFTMGVSNTGSLNFSVVDMSLSSGHGSVTVKNSYLYGPCLEKLTAVKHANNSDVWILVHESGTSTNFLAFLLDATGVNTTPVTSNVGANGNVQSIGYLRASPDGQHVASAFYGGTPAVELYDFNNATGQLSNPIQLSAPGSVYGCEFSPDGTKLYGSSTNGYITQWQICLGTASAIAASQYTMAATNNWAMQLAPDGKIYVSRYLTSSLGVIHNPNLAGSACGYVNQSFTISGTCRLGLPNYVTSWFAPPPPNFTVTIGSQTNVIGCMTASFTSPSTASLTLPGCSSLTSSLTGVTWNFGDPGSGSSNTSTLAHPSHQFSSMGTYTTTMILWYSGGAPNDTLTQTVQISQPCISVSSTSITCASLGSATATTYGGMGPFSYTWMPTNQTSSVATGLNPGSYTITVFDLGSNQSFTSQAIFTSLVPLTGNLLFQQDLLCHGALNGTATVNNLAGGSGNQSYLWTNGSTTYTADYVSTLGAGLWTVTVTDAVTACSVTNIFFVSQPPPLTINIAQTSNTACVASNVTLSALASGGTPFQASAYNYTWLPGNASNISVVTHSLPGSRTFTVLVTDSNSCALTKTTSVAFVPNPVLSVTNASICPLQTGTLSANGAMSYTWSNNSNSANISDNPLATTVYTVTGETAACKTTASASIVLKPAPVALITDNGPRCENTTLLLQGAGGVSYAWNGPAAFTSTLVNPAIANVSLSKGGIYSLTVTAANSCTAAASTTIVVNALPSVAAAGSTVCTTQQASLSLASSASTFTWVGPMGFASNAQNPSWLSGQTGYTGLYTVTAQSAAGCTALAVAHVSVVLPPSLSLSATQPSFCAQAHNGSPATVTLTASGALTYTLSSGGGLGNPNPSGPLMPLYAVPPFAVNNAVHTLTLEGSNSVCTSILTHTIQVVANPTVLLNDFAPAICLGQQFNFLATGATNYHWNSSVPQFTFYGNGSQAAAGPPASTQLEVYGTQSGCASTTEIAQLTVHPLPEIIPVPETLDLCVGSSVALGVKGTASSYTWLPATFLSDPYSPETMAAPPADIVYTITGSANNCTSSAQVSINILPLPVAHAWIPRPVVCDGDTFTLRGSGGLIYLWSAPDGSQKGGDLVSLGANQTRSGSYKLEVTDVFGCKNSAVAGLTVNPLPAGTLDGITSGCVPFCTDLSFNPFSNHAVTASWQVGARVVSAPNFSACFNTAGEHHLNGFLTNTITGCRNSAKVTVHALPLPRSDFRWFPEKPVAGYEPVQLTETTGDDELEFTWYFLNEQRIFDGPSVAYSFENEGEYAVALVVQDKMGCMDSLVRHITVDPDFVFFMPNSFTPNGDGINDLLFPVTGGIKQYRFSVFARWGEKLFESEEPGHGWNGVFKGKNCKQDVYVWTVSLTNHEGKNRTHKGTVMLLR